MKTFRFFKFIGILGILGLFCFSSSASASERGPKSNTRSYPINGLYHKLVVGSGFDITLSDTAKAAIVTVPAEAHKHVVVELSDGTLHVALRDKVKLKNRPTLVLPRNDRLDNIELTDGATFSVGSLTGETVDIFLNDGASFRGDITAKQVNIEQAGGTDYRGKIFVDNVNLNLRGASTIELRGRCLVKMDLKMREASNLDAEKLEVRRIEGSLGDASNAVVWCTERLSVPVNDASHLVYIGRPRLVNCPTGAMSSVVAKQKR